MMHSWVYDAVWPPAPMMQKYDAWYYDAKILCPEDSTPGKF